MGADDDPRCTLGARRFEDAGRRIALPHEDLRSNAGGPDPPADLVRVVLTGGPSLVDPFAEPPTGQPQPAGVDRVDDHKRDAGLERHPDRDALGRGRDGAELGRKHDRSGLARTGSIRRQPVGHKVCRSLRFGPVGHGDGLRHGPTMGGAVVTASLPEGLCGRAGRHEP